MAVGDIILLKEDGIAPTKWPIAQVMMVHPGNDGLMRVATVRTTRGMYKRSVSKIALLVSEN